VGDYFGTSVSTAGDLNGDGFDDVVVGAFGNNAGGTDAGRSYVYFSSSPPIKPRLASTKDVPNDQGEYINLNWVRSGYDAAGFSRLANYKVQRSNPPNNSGYSWETVATISPTYNKFYTYTANTWFDSSSNSSGTIYYRILAQGTDSDELWISNIKSGHSVDNLSPGGVSNLANSTSGGNVVLNWTANTEADLYNYQIYRTTEATIDPNTATVYAATTDATYTDTNSLTGTINYFVRAVDINGNAGTLSSTEANVILTTNLKILLEGANAGSGTMTTFLNGGGYIPLSQPYSGSPWNYSGTESVVSIPSGVVDWVLIELRTNTTTIAETRAAFLKSDGTLVDTDGTSAVNFPNSTAGNYYVVVKHRNHIPIMTASAVPLSNNPPLHNMTQTQSNTYGSNPLKSIGGGYYGMFAGDGNLSEIVTNSDKTDIINNLNSSGYYNSDTNMSGIVTNSDKTVIIENINEANQVPTGTQKTLLKISKKN
ncbi:MAG: integrin alpha, partial [Melioribacteraceae bacterium]|nr:integrin alpha [Melioribacteraceae bacterium]